MNTRSVTTKLLALIIALMMMMSVASVALAVEVVETFTVTFQAEGQADTTQQVVSGDAATEPANPSIPAGKSSFIGWFLSGVEQTLANRYNFATPITAPTTLVAGFSDKWLVEFFNADGLVIDSKLVANGGTVTATAVSVTPPANMIFVDWRVEGAATAYSFATPVTSNLKLTPHFANTFYVYFISKGSTVNHQIVVDGAKATKPTNPTRAGYTFSHWSLTDGGTAFNFTTTSITANTTLYGVWTAQTVNYTVVYWLEKPNVSGDPGTDFNNYMFNKSETKTAPAGSTVSGASISLSTINYAQFHHGATVTVAGNGTSVLNVYFNRIVYTLNFDLNETEDTNTYRNHVARMTIGGVTYTDPQTYSISAKYEQSIGSLWPTMPNASFSQTADIFEYSKKNGSWDWRDTGDDLIYKFNKWNPPSSIYSGGWVTKRLTLTTDMIPSSGTSYTITAQWDTDLVNKTVNYWFEQYPGQVGGETRTYDGKTYVKSTAYSQSFASKSGDGLSPKTINGVTYIGSDNKYVGGVGYVNEYNFFYTRNIHALKFNSQGGSSIADKTGIMFEQPVAGFEPANPTRAGYTFKGWYLEAEYHTLFNFATTIMPNSDVMLFAKWESSQYTVRFHSSLGGEVVASQGIAQDAYVTEPNLFTIGESYAGYGVFLGWYWYLPGTTLLVSFNWETPAPGDMDLYARWRTDGLTVTYNAGAGSGAVPVDIQTYDLNVQALVASGAGLTAPAGKVFVGWQVGGAGVTYYPGTTVVVNGNITLVARYIDPSNALALTFDSNYAGGEADVSWTVEKNVALNLAGTIFTRSGYTLLGWADNAIDTAAAYALGSAFTPTAAKTFYAVWQQDTVTVTFDTLTGGTLSGTELIQTVPVGTLWSQITVPTTTANSGYLFDGWYVGESLAVFPATVTTNLTYTAHWTAKPIVKEMVYTLHYMGAPSDMTGVNWPADPSAKSASPTLSLTMAQKIGATFSGWQLNNTGANLSTLTVVNYTNDGTYTDTEGATQITRTYEYVANVYGSFTALNADVHHYYTVSYLLDGAPYPTSDAFGETEYANQEDVPTAVAPDVTPGNGQTFHGWDAGSVLDLSAITWSSTYVTVTGPITVTPAGYGTAAVVNYTHTLVLTGSMQTLTPTEDNDYTIVYQVNGVADSGLGVGPVAAAALGSVTIAGTPAVPNGYTFTNWDYSGLFASSDFAYVDSTVTPAAPNVAQHTVYHHKLVINANLTKNVKDVDTYELTYALTDTDPTGLSAAYSTGTGVLSAPPASLQTLSVKPGYSFSGWSVPSWVAGESETATVATLQPDNSYAFVRTTPHTASVSGTLTKNVGTSTTYVLNYLGDSTGAVYWPANVTDDEAFALAAQATKNGFTFYGWSVSEGGVPVPSVDWNASYVHVTSGVEVYDEVLQKFITPITRTINVYGSFTQVADTVNKLYTVIYKADLNHDGTTEEITMTGFSVSEVFPMPTEVAGAPTMENGYTFGGWDKTALTQADFGDPTFDGTIPSTQPGVGAMRTIKYTLTITGTINKTTADADVYRVNYSVTNPSAVVSLYAAYEFAEIPFNAQQAVPSVKEGYKIEGWFVGETNCGMIMPWPSTPDSISEPTLVQLDGVWTFVTYHYYTLNAVATVTENAHETKNVYNLSYKITGTYQDFEGNALSALNIPDAQLDVVGTSPELSGVLPTMDGHTFSGWSALNWGTGVHTTQINTSTNAIVDVYTYTTTVQGAFERNEVVTNNYYSLSYSISGSYTHPDGSALTPSAPSPVTNQLNSKPTLVSGNALDGHSFAGWMQDTVAVTVGSEPTYSQVGTTAYTLNAANHYVATSYFAAAVVGSYTSNGLEEHTFWNLTYTGDSALADFGTWPGNFAGESLTAPALTSLVPAKLGYTFSGWMQDGSVVSSIDWTPAVQYSLGADNKFVKTTTNSASLEGLLTKNESITTYVFNVEYYVDGVKSGITDTQSGSSEVNALVRRGAPTVIAGREFLGWDVAAGLVDFSAVTAGSTGPSVNEQGKWETIITKNLAVNGETALVQNVNEYTLTFGAGTYTGAVVPDAKFLSGSEPTILSTDVATLAGFHFTGWTTPDYAKNGGAVRIVSGEAGNQVVTYTQQWAATVTPTMLPITERYLYNVTYSVSGVDTSVINKANVVGTSTTGPALEADLENTATAIFFGWYKGGALIDTLDWSTIDFAEADGVGAQVGDDWQITYTKSVTLTGEYTNIVTKQVYQYNLNFTSAVAGATLPENIVRAEDEPSIPNINTVTAPAGYRVDKWDPSSLTWGNPVRYNTVTSADGTLITEYYESTATTQAQFVPTGTAKVYTLHYSITSSVEGQPANPADEISASEITPNDANVAAILPSNFYFSGWSAPAWGEGSESMAVVDGVEITTTSYETTVTGFYTDMKIVDGRTLYTLLYQGYVSGAIFWPADVIAAETQPEVSGTPYLAGYIFAGWTPATIDWSMGTITSELVQAYETDGTPYLIRVYTNTVQVRATFTQDNIPLNPPPEDEEIPIGSPNTGSEGLLGLSTMLAIIGTAIVTTTVIRKRRNEAQDGE